MATVLTLGAAVTVQAVNMTREPILEPVDCHPVKPYVVWLCPEQHRYYTAEELPGVYEAHGANCRYNDTCCCKRYVVEHRR